MGRDVDERQVRSRGLKERAAALLALAAVITVCAARLHWDGTPEARSADAPKGEFSAARAMVLVKELAAEIRSPGSSAREKARDRIVERLRALGLEPSVRKSPALRSWFRGYHTAGQVENITAVVPGTGDGKALLFMAHYDSVTTGPGAADDISGVAAMLEAVRALKEGAPPKVPCVFLFTDGEEAGLLGASAFVRDHPLRDSAGMTVNLEARGTRGPSILFETGPRSGGMVRAFARHAPSPVGNSLTAAVYSHLPNDTDFSVFRDQGRGGLNFAFVGGVTAYHTALDRAGNLDPRSLQHHGDTVLALARGVTASDLEAGGPDPVYFNPFGSWMLVAGPGAAACAAVPLIAAAVFFVVTGLRAGRVRPSGLAFSVLAVLAVPALMALAFHGLVTLLFLAVPSYSWMIMGEVYGGGFVHMALSLLSIGACLAVMMLLFRKPGAEALTAAALLVFVAAAACSLVLKPGTSFLFLWPLAWATAAGFVWRAPLAALVKTALTAVLSLPVAAFAAHMAADLYTAMTLRFAALAVLIICIYGVLCAPLAERLLAFAGRLLPVAAAAAGLAFLAAGIASSGFDAKHPRPDAVAYVHDADTGDTLWASCDPGLDGRTGRYFPSARRERLALFEPVMTRCFFKSHAMFVEKAPDLKLTPPAVAISGGAVPGGRKAVVRIRSSRGAPGLMVLLRDSGRVRELSVDGIPAGMGPVESLKPGYRLVLDQADLREWTVIHYAGLPAEGVELSITIKGDTPLELRVLDFTWGTPRVPGEAARPADTMPSPDFLLKDSAISGKRFKI